MKNNKMELMDWKQIETSAEEQLRTSEVQKQIALILYESAIIEIKKLGGMTNREQDKEAAKKAA